MEVSNLPVARDLDIEIVAAVVSSWVVIGEAIGGMERLVHVSNVVDEQPQVKRVAQVPADCLRSLGF